MSQEMNLSEEDMKIRQDLASRLQNNILSIGDIEAAIGRLTKQNEKYAPKEPVLEEA